MHRSFSLKPSVLILATFATWLSAGAGSLGAQSNGTWRISPEPNRRAVEAPPKPREPEFGSPASFGGGVFPRQPVALVMIPAILMSDGTILANFGMGFEPVRRSCGGLVVVNDRPTVVSAGGRVLSRPTYTQPVPNQVVSSQTRYPILTAASQSACFSRDGSGNYFVVRQ